MINKNLKKGTLLTSETLKIIIGVICVSFLIILLTSIYFSSSDNKKKEEAENLISHMNLYYSSFDENYTFQIIPNILPGGWMIFSFSDDSEKPDSCAGLDCICICEDVLSIFGTRQLKECSKNGVCKIYSPLTKEENVEIKKDGSTSIYLYKKDGWYGVRDYEFG